jgi:hypothetical protein
VKQNQTFAGNDRPTETFADLFFPYLGRAAPGKPIDKAGFFGYAVAIRAEELRPITRGCLRYQK